MATNKSKGYYFSITLYEERFPNEIAPLKVKDFGKARNLSVSELHEISGKIIKKMSSMPWHCKLRDRTYSGMFSYVTFYMVDILEPGEKFITPEHLYGRVQWEITIPYKDVYYHFIVCIDGTDTEHWARKLPESEWLPLYTKSQLNRLIKPRK